MKKFYALLMALSFIVPGINAEDSETSQLREEVRMLKEQLQRLEQRIQAQSEPQSDRLQNAPSAHNLATSVAIPATATYSDRMGNGYALLKEVSDRITFSGNLDILGFYSNVSTPRVGGRVKSEDTSDIIIDQLKLNVDIDVTENVKGYVSLQFEDYQNGSYAPIGGTQTLFPQSDTEDDNDLQVDEAYITIGGEEGAYGILGRQYMPFGHATENGRYINCTNFINDTLAKQMHEVRDTGAVVGYRMAGIDFNVFGFNGQLEQSRRSGVSFDNKLDTWGSSATYAMSDEDYSFRLGLSVVNNILQVQNTAARSGLDILGNPTATGTYLENDNEAFDLYTVATFGPLFLSAEYVSAFDEMNPKEVANLANPPAALKDQKAIKPKAYTLEAGFTFPALLRDGMEDTVSIKYEENNDQDSFGNPIQNIWGIGISSNILERTKLSLNYEYWNLEDDGLRGNLPGGHAKLYLAELSIGF